MSTQDTEKESALVQTPVQEPVPTQEPTPVQESAITKNQRRRAKLKEKKAAKKAEQPTPEPPKPKSDAEVAQQVAVRKAKRILLKDPKNATLTPEELETKVAELSKKYIPSIERAIKNKKESQEQKQVSITSAKEELSIDEIVKRMDGFWQKVLDYVKEHPEFKDKPDKEKLELFRNAFGYTELMNEYPVITRYIVCMGQYKTKAFRKMLEKTIKMKHPGPQEREKGYMEDQWIRRQADYVQFMWEEYQTRHYNTAEKKWVWQETYKRLKGEFDDFRNMHKDIEKKVEEEKKILVGRNVRDLLERLKTGKQHIKPEEEIFLRSQLESAVFLAKYKEKIKPILAQLKSVREAIPPAASGEGHADENERKQQKIKMVETVDVARMGEIDDKFKPAEYRGMEPVLEYPINPEELAEGEEVVEETEIVD